MASQEQDNKTPPKAPASAGPSIAGPYSVRDWPEEVRKQARRFFEHAETVAQTRNYDYAVELYLQGLARWPEAVDEGHKPLYDVALRRKASGGKKPGMVDSLKRSTSGKDAKQAMLNAEFLLAKDPANAAYLEALAKNADKEELPDTLRWALGLLLDIAGKEKKLNAARLILARELAERCSDHYNAVGNQAAAVEMLERAVRALELIIEHNPGRSEIATDQRDLAGKLTILKGKYSGGGDFRDSIRDADTQKALMDSDRLVKRDSGVDLALKRAREEVEANPDSLGKISTLVDMLLQRDKQALDDEALQVLDDAYQRLQQYSLKMRADDVRIRKLARKSSAALAAAKKNAGDEQARKDAQKAAVEQLRFELQVYAERIKQYPTDNRLKYEYGLRLMRGKKYDEAIPAFQAAASDPKYRVRAMYNVGQCFYQKGWYDQATDTLTQAIEAHDVPGDNLSKDMAYLLGLCYEKNGKAEQAIKEFSRVVQWDFNYKDVRDRIEQLRSK